MENNTEDTKDENNLITNKLADTTKDELSNGNVIASINNTSLSNDVTNSNDNINSTAENACPRDGNGSQKLVDKYNINDKAHSDSSEKDFIKTTSNFLHANQNDSEK